MGGIGKMGRVCAKSFRSLILLFAIGGLATCTPAWAQVQEGLQGAETDEAAPTEDDSVGAEEELGVELGDREQLGDDVEAFPGPLQRMLTPASPTDRMPSAAMTEFGADAPMPQKPPGEPIKYPTVAVHGAMQIDGAMFSQDTNSHLTVGDLKNGADFRRTRLLANGEAWNNVDYFFQMDFGFFGRPTFADVWMEVTQLPTVGHMRVGHFKQPFGLEALTSYRFITFMERSLTFQPFVPFRHTGVMFYNWRDDEMMTWAISGYRTGEDQFGGAIGDRGGNATAMRVTWLPYYDVPAEGRYLFHIGADYNLAEPTDHRTRFFSIPEIFMAQVQPGPIGTSKQPSPGSAIDGVPFFVDTGVINARTINTLELESALVWGSFSLQSELVYAIVDQPDNKTVGLPGMYLQASYFLTGEHRPYNRKGGTFDRVVPFEDFFRTRTEKGVCGGKGAWELTSRISSLNLNAHNIQGGRLTDLTVGVNWYLNPYSKFMFNYIHAWLDDPIRDRSGTDIVAMRAQVDF